MYLRFKKLFPWFQRKIFLYQVLRSVTLLLTAIMKQIICVSLPPYTPSLHKGTLLKDLENIKDRTDFKGTVYEENRG